jgi:hypothetical protein
VWIFQQKTGLLSKDGIRVGLGYSGFEEGKNNPEFEHVPDVGVIPAGLWTIGGPPFDTDEHGPYVLRLDPQKGTEVFGRSGFLIHGDSIEHPGEASKGCIVTDRDTRRRIWQSGDTQLSVIPGGN